MDDFATVQSAIQSALVRTTRTSKQLAAEDLPFHRTLDPSIGRSLDEQNARLLSLASRLLGSATAHAENVRPTLRDLDDVENNWSKVVDVVDSLLERADTALDEFTGAVKRLSPREQTPTGKTPAKPSKISAALRAQDIEKPQLLFDNVPSNRETEPFRPLLETKPHATVPLATEPVAGEDNPRLQFAHPYEQEIKQYTYPSTVYTHSEPINYHPFESTTATFVDTEEALDEMLKELKKAREIAVDLEHHDQRSYIGIVCLMQISTRDRDWIVDTLKPWRRKLQSLNEVFTDPSIVKILHGAHMDSIWLQRDLGLYLVGLFDTHHASRALGYPGGSYAFLLQKFTGVQAQKQYQTADWRIRPLPKELVDYARSDTHYLLYIYDNMRNELIERSDFSVPNHEKDKVHDVCEKSKDYALQRYEHPIYDSEYGQGNVGWYKMLARAPPNFSKQEFAVFRALHKWRDEVAREQDDSTNYVFPNHVLHTLARSMPSSRAELLRNVQPATQTMRLRADEIVATINQARSEGVSGPEVLELMAKIDPYHWKKAMEKTATDQAKTFEGVAKYLPQNQTQTAPAPDGLLAAMALPLRSGTSMFWGATQQQQQRRPVSTTPDVQLSVPLPPLNAEIFAEAPTIATPVKPDNEPPAAVAESSPPPAETDDSFILKQLGKNKKRKLADNIVADDDALATQTDEVTIPDSETARAQAKAAHKQAKKEAKRAAKASTNGEAAGETGTTEQEAVFDYANVPSMLNPPRLSKEELKKERKKQKDPYAKSLDAPKGLPRAQRERAGKSMTFKE